ncbi:MAG: Ig-like domain-containing protein [bacterium]
MKYKLVNSRRSLVVSRQSSVVSRRSIVNSRQLSVVSRQSSLSIINYQLSIKFCLLFAVLLFSCANPQPPSGGPPDKSPPIITRYAPAQGTTNYKEKSITIEFNKYMNKNTVLENIFISPSVKMKFDWSGKELEIEFEEELKDSTTYVFSLGTEYSDLKGNKPAESFSLIFSTGSFLDSCSITGTLIDPKPTGTNIYAYRIDNINPDTLNPSQTKPNYRTQSGQNGKFDLVALKEGKYRVIAIRDKFKDEVYDEGLDDFGAAPFDVEVTGDSVPVVNLKIGPTKDNTGPQLFSAEGLNSNLIELVFSERLDTNFVKSQALEIWDSTGIEKADVSGAMLSLKSPDKIWVFSSEQLDTNILWKILAIPKKDFSLRDTVGNLINDTANFAYFYAENSPNQIQPELLKMPYPDSSLYVPVIPDLNFVFNLPLSKSDINNSISFMDGDSVKINFDVNWKSDNIMRIIPKNKLEPLKWYIINFRMNEIEAANEIKGKDTTLRLKFRIQDTRNFGGIKGRIKDLHQPDSNLKIIIFNPNFKMVTSPADSGKWSIPSLPEGKYKFELYYDFDGNGKYSYGEAYPFEHSEPFILIKEEKEVPARWTIELELPAPAK